MSVDRTEQLLRRLAILGAAIRDHEAAAARAYERRLAIFHELVALGVPHRVIAQAAGVTPKGVTVALHKARHKATAQ